MSFSSIAAQLVLESMLVKLLLRVKDHSHRVSQVQDPLIARGSVRLQHVIEQ